MNRRLGEDGVRITKTTRVEGPLQVLDRLRTSPVFASIVDGVGVRRTGNDVFEKQSGNELIHFINALDVSLLAQGCGCEMIIIHPRLQTGRFSSALDFDLVREIKNKVKIPVVFSGNVTNAKRAQMTYEKTGVDGLMIGRPLWGAPWKIKEIIYGLEGEKFSISNEEAVKCALEHLDLNMEFYGDKGFQAFKKHAPQYIKNIPDAALIRKELVKSLINTFGWRQTLYLPPDSGR